MPAEHYDERRRLCQGYFCSRCGESCAMLGHDENDPRCVPNPAKVRALTLRNNAPYPQFCRHPHICTRGRCESAFVCND